MFPADETSGLICEGKGNAFGEGKGKGGKGKGVGSGHGADVKYSVFRKMVFVGPGHPARGIFISWLSSFFSVSILLFFKPFLTI